MAAAWSQVPADDEPLSFPDYPTDYPPEYAPPPEYPPQRIPDAHPDRAPSASRATTWFVVAVAAVIVVVATLVVVFTGGSDDVTRPSAAPPGSSSAGPPGSAPTTGSPGTPSRRSIPPTVQGPDSTGETCPTGYAITGRDGWASASVRGNDATTCAFAGEVLNAYWEAGPPSRNSRTVVAAGPVPCPGGPSCSGSDYVMNCGLEGTSPWITCRGAGDALVYLF